MLLLKRGGETIFNGPLGYQSQNMISYFESIPGVITVNQESLSDVWGPTYDCHFHMSNRCWDTSSLIDSS